MNHLEQRSFYSFLGLYILSSFLFLAGIGYWYYTAQKNALANENYYKLQHIADMKSGEIIMAHMSGNPLKTLDVPKEITLALINTQGEVVEGELVTSKLLKKEGYFIENGYTILISDAPKEHLNIMYVVAQSNFLTRELSALSSRVFSALGLAALLVVFIAWVLSKLFMRPVHQRVNQVERFINDITHELNTPITSLSMSTNQALQQEGCTKKMLNNISISTKQLYDIYRSLTYLNFSTTEVTQVVLDLKKTVEKSVVYYGALAEMKRITFEMDLEKCVFSIPEEQATLLFGNLIGNAIKYSPVNSKVEIVLKENVLRIEDEGIGIAPKKQKEIFETFTRGTAYSGGFGVGLSIVKRICDEYKIKIDVDSTLHEGTRFTLTFPLKA